MNYQAFLKRKNQVVMKNVKTSWPFFIGFGCMAVFAFNFRWSKLGPSTTSHRYLEVTNPPIHHHGHDDHHTEGGH